MKIIILSLDSGTDAQRAALWNEVERTLGCSEDPLDLLIAEEDELDIDLAVTYMNAIYRRAHGRGCSFPQCYQECRGCRNCAHREGSAR